MGPLGRLVPERATPHGSRIDVRSRCPPPWWPPLPFHGCLDHVLVHEKAALPKVMPRRPCAGQLVTHPRYRPVDDETLGNECTSRTHVHVVAVVGMKTPIAARASRRTDMFAPMSLGCVAREVGRPSYAHPKTQSNPIGNQGGRVSQIGNRGAINRDDPLPRTAEKLIQPFRACPSIVVEGHHTSPWAISAAEFRASPDDLRIRLDDRHGDRPIVAPGWPFAPTPFQQGVVVVDADDYLKWFSLLLQHRLHRLHEQSPAISAYAQMTTDAVT